jgi:DNA-binding NarL/FixJ family response regulator
MPRTYNEHNEIHENPFGLTNKQRDTIQMLANGYSQKDVAKMQGVSWAAIKDRMFWIRMRMDVDTTLQAVVLWIREVEFADHQVAA